ncbi:MAG: Sec-dependent nitrous-oxide reductase [Leptospiraceae bacterium]|nr:Sec-dependent nitrous-oxide reductase [Leptospiraceae bacterium]
MKIKKISFIIIILFATIMAFGCKKGSSGKSSIASNAAQRVYVAPGDWDEVYGFMSGGFSGQVTVYGIPSGRLFKVIPVFSQFPENGYGYDEGTKGMLMTSQGFIPWDDSHHPEASVTNGKHDGRWLFINGNNTPRIARIDLDAFETKEIIEIPNSAGNHASPFATENTEYLMAATRFSVPVPQQDMPIESYSEGKFYGTVTMVKVDKDTGKMSIDLQVLVPGFNYDLSHCGKGQSHDWCFFSTYNTEQAYEMLEVKASKNDKDYMLAFNWVKAKQCSDEGKSKDFGGTYYRNYQPDNLPAVSEKLTGVKLLDPKDCPGMMYFLPTPKSPHGSDVDPTGEYIVGGGKLATVIPVHSFSKFMKAKDDESNVTGKVMEIPILKYESTLAGEVKKPCLGPLHTEFDGKGYAYTSCFVTSEVIKWKLGTWEVVQHMPSYYSVGHLSVVGGDTKEPYGKYLVALNKITKDRYLPVGMELAHSAQLFDISGGKVELLLDFPTMGEPHYAQMLPATLLKDKAKKIYKLEENKHPYATKNEKDARVERNGKEVHVYMTGIRSHFKPDKVEVKLGDTVYFHVTNLEQDFDIPHGFAVYGADLPNLLIMPGQTRTVKWVAKNLGVFPFYCTDFCSALHQEMQQYIRVSP